MKKSFMKFSIIVVVLALSCVLAGCGAKKDLTGRWRLDSITAFDTTIRADDLKSDEFDLTEIGFEIKNDTEAAFIQFGRFFDEAMEAFIKAYGVDEEDVEQYEPLIMMAFEQAGIKEEDIEKYYEGFDTQTYTLSGNQFSISTDGQKLLEGTLKNGNTIVVSDFFMEGIELIFVREK